MPDNFRFYDLRHIGNAFAADTGAKLTKRRRLACLILR